MALLVLVLPGLIWLSRLPSQRDWDERTSVRDQAADACSALDRPPAGLAAVSTAVEAFEADKQVALSIAARQAESHLRGGTHTPQTIRDLAADCRAVYEQ